MAEVIQGMNLRNSAMIPSSNIPKAASFQETAKQPAIKQTDIGSHMQADKASFATNEKVNTKLNARDNIDKALNGYLSTSEQQAKTSNKPQNQINTQKSQSFIAMQQMRGNALNKNAEGIKQAITAETRGQQGTHIKNELTQLKNAEATEKKSDSAKSVKTETVKTAVANETKQQAVQAKNNNIQLKNTEAATKQAESIKNSEKAAEADSAKTARAAETALQQDLDKTKITRTRKAYSKTLETIKDKSAHKSSEETKDSGETSQPAKNTRLQKQNSQRTAISRIEQRVPEEQKNIKNTEAQKQSVKEQATAENQKGIERQNQAERKGETLTRNAIRSVSIQKGAEAENKRNIEKQDQSEKRAAEKSEATSRQAESRSQNTPSRTAASNPATTAQHNQNRGPVRGSLSGSTGAMETPSRGIPQRGADENGAPSRGIPQRGADENGAPSRGIPQRGADENGAPSRGIPQRGADENGTPSRGIPQRGADENGAPSRGIPQRGADENGAPSRGIPQREAAENGAPSRGIPQRGADENGAPSRGIPQRGADENGTPSRGIPQRGADENGTPSREIPQRGADENGTPSRGIPQRGAAENGTPSRGIPQRGADENGTPSRGIPQREAAENGAPSRGIPQRGADENGAPSRGIPQRGADENGAPSRGIPQRGATENGAPNRGIPQRETAENGTPSRGIPQRGATENGAPSRGIPQRGAAENGAPSRGIPQRGAAENGTPSRGIPQRGAAENGAPSRGIPQRGAAENGTPSRGIPQRGAAENGTPSRGIPQRGADENGAPSRGIPQRGAAENGAPSRGIPQRGAEQPVGTIGSVLTSIISEMDKPQTLHQPNTSTGSFPTSVLPNINMHHTQTVQQPNAAAGSFPTSVLPNINMHHTHAVQQPNAAAGSFPTSVLPNINMHHTNAVQQPNAAGILQTSPKQNIQINGIIGGIMSQIASLPSIANSINPNNQVSQILARHNTSLHTAPLFRKPRMTIQSSLQSWNGPAAGKTANIYWKYPSYGHTDITNSWHRSDSAFMSGNRWGWEKSSAIVAPHIFNKIQEGASGSRITSSVTTSSPSRWTIKNAPIPNSVQKWHGHDSTITASSHNLRISSEFSAEKAVSRTQAGPFSDIMLMSNLKDIKINRFSARTEAAAEPKTEYFKQNRIHVSENGNDYMRPSSSLIKSNNSRGGTITIPSPSKTLEKEAVSAQHQSYRLETQGALASGKSDIAEEYEQWASKDLASSSETSTKRKALNALRSRMMKNKGAKEIEEKKSEENDLKETKRQINAEKQADVRSASNTRASETASKHSDHIRENAIKEEKYESDGKKKGKEDRDYAAIDYSGRSSSSSGRDNQSNLSFSQQQKTNNENSAKNARQSSEAEGKMPQSKAGQASDDRKNAPMLSASSVSGGNIPPHMLQGKAGQAPAFNSQYANILRDESFNMSQTSSAARARHEKAAISNVSTSLESTLKKSNKEIWSGDEVAAKLLFMLMKSSDKQVYEHSERVIDLSSELAIEMGIKDPQFLMELKQSAAFCDVGEIEFKLDSISEETRKELSVYFKEDEIKNSGFLHDIGNVFIPSEILNKRGKLTAEEYAIVKQHPETGEKMLKDIPGLAHTAPAVRHHHERWDGKGYPDAIGGEDIPYQARLIAVCDSFDAMVSDRPYRQGMSLDEALNEIQKGSGTQFDPIIANAFIQMAQKKYGIDR